MELERSIKKVALQGRDLEILRFCLEMKFADIEILNSKFFDPDSLEMFAARKRVQKLEASGFLKSVSMLSGTTRKFYLTTKKGYREVLNITPDENIPEVVTKLSVVTFEHDLGVLKLRKLLEEQRRATHWQSERLLKNKAHTITQSLKREFMPDALFTSKQGKVVAFEFENKPKTETQLREKLFRLKAIIESNDAPFEACLVVTSTDNLKKKIQTLTHLMSNKFIVQSVSDIKAIPHLNQKRLEHEPE